MNNLQFNILEIENIALSLDYKIVNKNESKIEIELMKDWIIVFENIEDNDTIISFNNNSGSNWHTHADCYQKDSADDAAKYILSDLKNGYLLLIDETFPLNPNYHNLYFSTIESVISSIKNIDSGESIKIQRLRNIEVE